MLENTWLHRTKYTASSFSYRKLSNLWKSIFWLVLFGVVPDTANADRKSIQARFSQANVIKSKVSKQTYLWMFEIFRPETHYGHMLIKLLFSGIVDLTCNNAWSIVSK